MFKLKKIFNKKTGIQQLQEQEKTHYNKSWTNPDYYHSNQARINGKQITKDKKRYLQEHPDDYLRVGASIQQILWNSLDEISEEDKRIFSLTGEGKYYEDKGDYDKAIKLYREADNLTLTAHDKEIKELVDRYGPGDYLYTSKIRQRIRVCERYQIKRLEEKAKSMEKTDIQGAIRLYERLNVINPGLKKYNQRLGVLNRRLKKQEQSIKK